MRRNILGTIGCFLILLILTGCGNKKVITTNDFKDITSNYGCASTDVLSQYAAYPYVKEATIAQNFEGWQVEFYVLDNVSNAKGMFETNKNNFIAKKANSSLETSANLGNYSSYSLTSGGYYMHVCRVDNTLLFVNVSENYKDKVKSLIDELGY